MKHKINEWLKRYLPAEIISMILTVVSAELAFGYTENKLTTALVATVIGNTAYFGCILLTDMLATRKHCLLNQQTYTLHVFFKNIRALGVEFGIAEVFDTLLIRPFLMYYLPILLNSLPWGTFLAKVTADITFYIPAIISYELSKKRLRDFL
jgi:uncharacterized membrane protein YeiH